MPSKKKKNTPKKAPLVTWEGLRIDTWFERDRSHIRLFRAPMRYDLQSHEMVIAGPCEIEVAEWWDDDAQSMLEDGIFVGRRGERELEKSVIKYAESMGLIRFR